MVVCRAFTTPNSAEAQAAGVSSPWTQVGLLATVIFTVTTVAATTLAD